jgi:hypothetical protein
MGRGGLYEYARRKLILESLTDEDWKAIHDSRESRQLKKIDRQTSTRSGIIQNIIGNVITDGAIYLLRRFLKL